MRTVLPGKPQAKLQALCTAQWEGLRLVVSKSLRWQQCAISSSEINVFKVYISGSALVILGGPHELLQTIYHDEHSELDAVAIDEATGKIATCSFNEVTIYKPYGREEGVLKV